VFPLNIGCSERTVHDYLSRAWHRPSYNSVSPCQLSRSLLVAGSSYRLRNFFPVRLIAAGPRRQSRSWFSGSHNHVCDPSIFLRALKRGTPRRRKEGCDYYRSLFFYWGVTAGTHSPFLYKHSRRHPKSLLTLGTFISP
jgi:hypothetical protein